jgi:transcriptional regulator with XRE-family HTH domain
MPHPHPVKVALAARGETQTQLAAAVKVTPGTLAQVVNGRHEAWPALRRRVAEYLGQPEHDLFPEHVDRLVESRSAQGFDTPSHAATTAIARVLQRATAVPDEAA